MPRISRGKESCARAGKAFAWPRNTGARRGPQQRKQPRACEARGRHKHGARLARRRRARAGKAFAQLQFTGARRGPTAKKQPRACEAGCKHKHGARIAHRRCAMCRAGRSCAASLLLCWLLCPVPVFPFCIVRAGFLPCFHPSLPNFFLSNLFSFVAHAATGTPFSFRKENGGKEPRGAR